IQEKKEQGKIQIDLSSKITGIVLASLWLVLSAFFIFNHLKSDSYGVNTFTKVSLPATVIAAALIIVRWKNINTTEMVLYAHGLFICVVPLIGQYMSSKGNSSQGLLLLLVYNAGYLILLYKKLKDFKLVDIIIASVEILYLSLLFFFAIFYLSFRPEYGDNETANTIGFVIGLAAGVIGIIFIRKKWIELRRK
ncbi:MAG: hypothetical protein ACHQF0_10360, partial [Chitinophagales bacterium]